MTGIRCNKRINILTVESNCLVIIGDSSIRIALRQVGHPAVIECVGMVAIKQNRLVEVCNGVVELIFGEVNGASTNESNHETRIEPDCQVVVDDNAIEVTLGFVSVTAVLNAEA